MGGAPARGLRAPALGSARAHWSGGALSVSCAVKRGQTPNGKRRSTQGRVCIGGLGLQGGAVWRAAAHRRLAACGGDRGSRGSGGGPGGGGGGRPAGGGSALRPGAPAWRRRARLPRRLVGKRAFRRRPQRGACAWAAKPAVAPRGVARGGGERGGGLCAQAPLQWRREWGAGRGVCSNEMGTMAAGLPRAWHAVVWMHVRPIGARAWAGQGLG
jgi:hypothetical protein